MDDRSIQTNERTEKLKKLILRLHQGVDEDIIKQEFAENFESVSPLEISVMERKLMKEEFRNGLRNAGTSTELMQFLLNSDLGIG